MPVAFLAGVSAFSLVFVSPAAAQDKQPAEVKDGQLEEIVVTAQKREESLQDVPMAISAVSASTLRDAGVIDMTGVARLVPSLITVQNNSPSAQSYRIRGIGSDPNIPTFEPDVALFIDGVYVPRSGLGVDDLVDISRVEVLKGPQSTLYGKNAVAGVVNVISAPPSNKFQASFEGLLSNIEGGKDALAGRIAGSITGPVTNGVRVRLTGVYYNQDHTFKNLTPGAGDANEMERYAVRGQVEIDLGSSTTLNLTAAHTKVLKSDMQNADLFLGNQALAESAIVVDAMGPLFGTPPCPDTDPKNRVICTTNPNQSSSKSNILSATLTSEFDFATLTAITAWSDYNYSFTNLDADQVSLPIAGFADRQEGNSVSQELRLVSPNDQRFEWLVGSYYLHTDFERGDNGNTPIFVMQPAARVLPLPLPPSTVAQLAPLFGGLAGLGALGLLTNPYTGGPLGTPAQIQSNMVLGQPGDLGFIDSEAESRYFAIFGQGTYHINDKVSLTGGLRWQTEKKTASLNNSSVTAPNPYFAGLQAQLIGLQAALPPGHPLQPLLPALTAGTAVVKGINLLTGKLVPTFVNGDLEDEKGDALTWTSTVDYKPTDSAMLYFTYAHGYKSGGHNIDFGNASGDSLNFNPEKVDNFEVGAKFDLLDKRARIAVSLFHTNYHDYQNAGFVGLQYLVNNAEKVRVNGFEFDSTMALAKGLTSNFGLTYLDAKFVEYTGGACPFGTPPDATGACDLSGKRLPLAPKVRITSGLQYEHDIGFGDAYGRIDTSWQSKTATNSANLDSRSIQDAFSLVNLRAGLRFDPGFDVSVWANNVLNKTYVQQSGVLNLFSSTATGMTTSGYQNYLGTPRQIGATLRKKF